MPAHCANLKSSDSSFSPTPTTDSTAKRLSWSKLMQKLTDFSGSSVNQSMDSDSDSCSRSECSESGKDCFHYVPDLSVGLCLRWFAVGYIGYGAVVSFSLAV